MTCGHSVHNKCYLELIKNIYKCPLCAKTIVDMTKHFDTLNKEIEELLLTGFEINYKKIYCNDCEKDSNTIDCYVGLKCQNCGSFNTRN
jgi:hypothetical protein